MIEVNGREYPMWSQFVEKKKEWIHGVLEDFGDPMDKAMGFEGAITIITDIALKPNGKTSAYFLVEGKDFSCGFDTGYGGICVGEEGWLTFSGYGGHKWRIKKNN